MKTEYTPMTQLSTLLIVVAPTPEVHYSTEGKVCVFHAVGLERLKFMIWANLENDSRLNDLLELPENAAIEVSGIGYVEVYKDKSKITQRRNLFVVNSWKKGW